MDTKCQREQRGPELDRVLAYAQLSDEFSGTSFIGGPRDCIIIISAIVSASKSRIQDPTVATAGAFTAPLGFADGATLARPGASFGLGSTLGGEAFASSSPGAEVGILAGFCTLSTRLILVCRGTGGAAS